MSTENTVKKPLYKKWWFWVVLLIALAAIGKGGSGGGTSSGGSASAAPIILPPMEARLIEIASTAQFESRKADNDMQRGGIKSKRDKGLCESITSLAVVDWIGTIKKIDSNSDGKGVLEIEIAPDILIKTWNNAFSDMGDHTLLEPGSPVFETAAAMKRGQKVIVSGTLLKGSEGECIKEGSVSLHGKISDPEFIFRFSAISAYDPAKQTAVPPVTATPAASPPNPAPDQATLDKSSQAASPQVVDGTLSETAILSKYKASFDCNKASTAVEKTTCSTPILNQLDGLLSEMYQGRMTDPAFGVDKIAFKAAQMTWVKTRNACADVTCLEKTYRARITELCEMPVVSGVHLDGDCDAIQN